MGQLLKSLVCSFSFLDNFPLGFVESWLEHVQLGGIKTFCDNFLQILGLPTLWLPSSKEFLLWFVVFLLVWFFSPLRLTISLFFSSPCSGKNRQALRKMAVDVALIQCHFHLSRDGLFVVLSTFDHSVTESTHLQNI